MSTYRLLRNNKETGPFSFEQLTTMGLKAYDLVWVDGKSAAWRYPSEVPELSNYAPAVEEQPFDRFYRRNPSAPSKTAKPRFRIKADWRKLEDAPEAPGNTATADNSAYAPAANNHHPASDVNAPAPPPLPVSAPQPASVAVAIAALDTRGVPETRYSESLDNIKERYSSTILQRNGSKAGNLFRYAALVGLFPVLAAGIWIGTSWSSRNKLENVPAETSAATAGQPQSAPAANSPAEELPQATPVEEPVPVPAIERSEVPGNNSTPASNQVTPRQIVVKNELKPVQAPKNNNRTVLASGAAGRTPIIRSAVNKTAIIPAPQATASRIAGNQQPAAVVAPLPAPSQAYENTAAGSGKNKINDYVIVNEEYEQLADNSRQIKLHVHNKSSIPLDLIVLDLQYYDANGRFKKGETLYVNNLSAHDEIALDAPAAKNNQRINYKVSLLSIEKKGIYLIAE